MELGICTSCLMQLTTEDALQEIAGLSVAAVADFKTFYEFRPEFSKAAKTPSLKVECVSARQEVFEGLLCDFSRRVRGDCLYWTDQLMRSANVLDCKNYAFRGLENPCNFDELSDFLREDYDFCAHYGVSFLLANSARGVYRKPGIFKEIKKRLPDIYGVFDMDEARKSGYPCGMYISDMANSVALVKVTVCEETKDIIKRLKGVGFNGVVALSSVKNSNEIKDELKILKTYIE